MHDNYKKANSARRCSRMLPDGRSCAQPALRGRLQCRFHDPIRRISRRFYLPVLEDAPSLQVACSEVVNALLTGKIDRDTAAVCFQGLRLASSNLPQFQREMQAALSETADDAPFSTAEHRTSG